MKKTTLLSIIVPIYNSEQYLEKCLTSIKNQTFADFEVLMINDGSTDNSKRICERYLSDQRFLLIDQENSGVSEARNNGIKQSRGKYLAFIDSDDYIDINYFNNLFAECVNGVDYVVGGLVYSNEYRLRKKAQNILSFPLDGGQRGQISKELYYNQLQKRIPEPCFGAPYGKLYKRSIIESEYLLFEKNENLAEDLVFNLRFLKYVDKIAICNCAGYYYRMYVANSLSRKRHTYEYSKKRWDIVYDTCVDLWGDSENKLERIKNVCVRNLVYALVFDKTFSIKEKKIKYSDLVEGKDNTRFANYFIILHGKILLRSIYRFFQKIIYTVRSIQI